MRPPAFIVAYHGHGVRGQHLIGREQREVRDVGEEIDDQYGRHRDAYGHRDVST